jgi:hypothetical protein
MGTLGENMVDRAGSVPPDSHCETYITPLPTRVIKIIFSLELLLLIVIIVPPMFAVTIYLLAIASGSPVVLAYIPAAVTYAFSVWKGWQLVTTPLRFRIVFGPDAVEIGSGLLGRRFAYDEVEAISMPEDNGGHGIALEDGANGAFVFLTPADEARCLLILRKRCKNAMLVDRSGEEYLPPSPDRPLVALDALYRRNRWLASGANVSIPFLGAFCIGNSGLLLSVLIGHMNLPIFDVAIRAFEIGCGLLALIWAIRIGRRRMKMAQIIRNKISEFRRNNAKE